MQTRRREVILDAALGVIAEEGFARLTHRAVDAAASLPPGSSTYYFSRKQHLVRGAAERLVWRLEADSAHLRATMADLIVEGRHEEAVELVAEDVLSCLDDNRDLFVARVELTLAAARDDRMQEVAAELAEAARRPLRVYLGLVAGHADPAAVETCLGIIDGLGLAYTTRTIPRPTVEQVTAIFRTVVRDGSQA